MNIFLSRTDRTAVYFLLTFRKFLKHRYLCAATNLYFMSSMFVPKLKNDIKTQFDFELNFSTFVLPMFMKKVAALFLLSIFLFNTAGYFIAFKVFQYRIQKEIKAEIKQQIDPSELTTIIIDKKNIEKINWVKKGKEMFYEGGLYDVVRSTEDATSIIYFCINDKQEELLFANLEDHINTHIASNKSTKNQDHKKISDHVIKLYFSDEQHVMHQNFKLNQHSFCHVDLFYKSALIEMDFPPPELA